MRELSPSILYKKLHTPTVKEDNSHFIFKAIAQSSKNVIRHDESKSILHQITIMKNPIGKIA